MANRRHAPLARFDQRLYYTPSRKPRRVRGRTYKVGDVIPMESLGLRRMQILYNSRLVRPATNEEIERYLESLQDTKADAEEQPDAAEADAEEQPDAAEADDEPTPEEQSPGQAQNTDVDAPVAARHVGGGFYDLLNASGEVVSGSRVKKADLPEGVDIQR